MRIVPDTNILARAARPDSLAAKVLTHVITGPHVLVLSPFLLAEVARVLRYPRLRAAYGLDDQAVDDYVLHLQGAAFVVTPGPGDLVPVVTKDPDDDHVLATAVVGLHRFRVADNSETRLLKSTSRIPVSVSDSRGPATP